MQNKKHATLYYFHDPMCSWCWGFRPTWLTLQKHLPENIKVDAVLGGLAPDSDKPMPQVMRAMLQDTWRKIHDELGAEFNFDFWSQNTPRRSTYPACRAVIAASLQDNEEEMIEAIQQAYYLRALNPSDDSILLNVAEEIGLDTEQFKLALNSKETQNNLSKQVALAKNAMVQGYPSLVLEYSEPLEGKTEKIKQYPIPLNYKHYEVMLERINNVLVC